MTALVGRNHDRSSHESKCDGLTRSVARAALLLGAISVGCAGCHHGRAAALPSLTDVRVMLADVERQRQEYRMTVEVDLPSATGPPKAESTSVSDYALPSPAGDSRQPSSILDARLVDYRPGRHQPGFMQGLFDSGGDAPAATREPGAESLRPLAGFGETLNRDLRRLPSQVWADFKSVYTNPDNLLLLGGTYGASLALQRTGPDDTVEESLREHRIFKDDWRDAFGAAGNPLVHFGLAGIWYVVGQQTQNEDTYRVANTLQRALIVNGLSVIVGQVATWDRGPNGELGAFPSGHTSSTFAVASVLHQSYGPWVGVPLYALGGLVAMERLDSHEHYLSDVVMGAMMGLVIGHTIAGDRELELAGGRIVPYVDPQSQSSGLAWVVHFK